MTTGLPRDAKGIPQGPRIFGALQASADLAPAENRGFDPGKPFAPLVAVPALAA